MDGTTNDQDAILDGIRHVAKNRLALAGPIDPNTEIVGDLELDSIQQLSLIVEIENHFRICFEPDDEEGVATVHDLMRVIATRLEASTIEEAACESRR